MPGTAEPDEAQTENTERIYQAKILCGRIEEDLSCLTIEAFAWDSETSSFEYNPQVSPREIYYLNEALKYLKFAVEGVKY